MEYDEDAVAAYLVHAGILDENSLTHHGVLGMKWHHHKGGDGSEGGGRTPRPKKAEIIEARHRQIALRKQYIAAKKAGDEKGAAKLATEFKNGHDRVTADHLTRGEQVTTLLVPGIGAQVSAGRTARSTQLKKSAIATRQVGAGLSVGAGPLAGVAPLVGAHVERKLIDRTIKKRSG